MIHIKKTKATNTPTYIERRGNSGHPLSHNLGDVGAPEGVVRLAVVVVDGSVKGGVDAQVFQVTFQHLFPVYLEYLNL